MVEKMSKEYNVYAEISYLTNVIGRLAKRDQLTPKARAHLAHHREHLARLLAETSQAEEQGLGEGPWGQEPISWEEGEVLTVLACPLGGCGDCTARCRGYYQALALAQIQSGLRGGLLHTELPASMESMASHFYGFEAELAGIDLALQLTAEQNEDAVQALGQFISPGWRWFFPEYVMELLQSEGQGVPPQLVGYEVDKMNSDITWLVLEWLDRPGNWEIVTMTGFQLQRILGRET